MMTLIGRLCALCAVSALMEMALSDAKARASLRMIGGLMMLHLTLSGARDLLDSLARAQGLQELLYSLMG